MEKFEETVNKILKFRDERDWKKFHNPKDLAISLNLEASELLELFQWKKEDAVSEYMKGNGRKRAEEEAADIFNYLVLFCDNLGINLLEAVNSKIEMNELRGQQENIIRTTSLAGGLSRPY